MLIVDSSAVVAMMLSEPGADALAVRLAAEPQGQRLIAAPNYVEAVTVLAGRRREPLQAIAHLDAFLKQFDIAIAPVDDELARIAMEARIRHGKGFGANAGLNFGDCFSYALAKALGAPLLYIGDDFGKTDIASAL